MAFEMPITIRKALDAIVNHKYVLPAIQREFVWKARQIRVLFDSLMRGYPIGSFLFWELRADESTNYRFYDFVTDYDIRSPHNTPIGKFLPGATPLAVLDGQQRLTALNVGLRGSYTTKQARSWWKNPDAFKKRRLYLNLRRRPDEDEDGFQYDFRFLTNSEVTENYWYPVPDIFNIHDNADLFDVLFERGLTDSKTPHRLLNRLHEVVHKDGVIPFFKEESQDLHKVLKIFVRTNSGGTVLSYSDMLLSIATAQWDRYDAREEIHGFVDEINTVGNRFSFTKDFVLKACLMLTDLNTEFKVTNFNADNMRTIQSAWEEIKQSVLRAVHLAASFGYDSTTLTAANSLLPVAYYLHRHGRQDSWLTRSSHHQDRARVQQWLVRSLLKRGIWGSGVDRLLVGLRGALEADGQLFPVEEIEREMARRGKSLSFDDEELEDLADMRFGDPRVFGVLRLLYDFVDVNRNQFHIDHVFPRARLKPAALRKEGYEGASQEKFRERIDGLANLQLLSGPQNVEKSAALPMEWLRNKYPDEGARAEYLRQNDFDSLPSSTAEFPEFYDKRRQRMFERLRSILGRSRPD